MGRRDHQRAALLEVVDDGSRQRAALAWVGAGAHFVEQHQRRRLQRCVHRDDVRDVRREGAQAGGDRLFVADVREHRSEHRQLRHAGGHVQAGLRHQREESRRLERDGLATGVWAGDQEDPRRRIDDDVDGHDVTAPPASSSRRRTAPISSGCRASRSSSRPSIAISWRDSVHDRTKARFRLQHVEIDRDLERGAEIGRPRAKGVGQLEQDAADLLALALLELDDVVVDFDRGRRFEEQARAARGAPVHDARHVATMLGSHHQHVAAVSLGDNLFLQVLRGVLAAHELIERRAQPLALLPQVVADAPQQRSSRDRAPPRRDRWHGEPPRFRP